MQHLKSVLITGCSSGIGLESAKTLHKRGYNVFATARKPEDLKMLADLGVHPIELDLDYSESVRAAVEQVVSMTNGNLYALFNNAAYAQPGAVEDLRRDILRQQFETNVFGQLELTNLLMPYMHGNMRGRIIFNASVLGYIAMPYRGAYTATKYAIHGIADTMRLELRKTNIKVSVISPGPITTKFREKALAHFLANIDREHSKHAAVYDDVLRRLQNPDSKQPFTLMPDAVVKKLVHALEARNPRANYYVTVPAYMFAYFKRILPTCMLDKLLYNIGYNELEKA